MEKNKRRDYVANVDDYVANIALILFFAV